MVNEPKSGSDDFVSLKVSETSAKFVEKGMALIDPAIIEEMRLATGDVIEEDFCFVMVRSAGRLRVENN